MLKHSGLKTNYESQKRIFNGFLMPQTTLARFKLKEHYVQNRKVRNELLRLIKKYTQIEFW